MEKKLKIDFEKFFRELKKRESALLTGERECTIAEAVEIVSKELGFRMTPFQVRQYEKLGIIKPRRKSNRYRIYNDTDISELMVIFYLRAWSISIQDIKLYINSQRRITEIIGKISEQLRPYVNKKISNEAIERINRCEKENWAEIEKYFSLNSRIQNLIEEKKVFLKSLIKEWEGGDKRHILAWRDWLETELQEMKKSRIIPFFFKMNVNSSITFFAFSTCSSTSRQKMILII